jgi:lipid A 3-O-deacylase
VLTPNFGPGLYGQGNGKKLGSYVEFRSTFEGGYVFDDGSRLVASFGHTSNAGLTKKNPGTEQAMISYQIPLYRLNSFFSP